MVTYLTLQFRRAAKRLFVLSDQRGSLSESILTSLAMFGLAAHGVCFASLAQPLPEVSKSDLLAER